MLLSNAFLSFFNSKGTECYWSYHYSHLPHLGDLYFLLSWTLFLILRWMYYYRTVFFILDNNVWLIWCSGWMGILCSSFYLLAIFYSFQMSQLLFFVSLRIDLWSQIKTNLPRLRELCVSSPEFPLLLPKPEHIHMLKNSLCRHG